MAEKYPPLDSDKVEGSKRRTGPDSPLIASIEESVVQENFVELLDDLDVKASVDLFFGRGFVTVDTMERINKATTRKDANRVLVTEFLAGISPSRFDKFVYILKETADKYHRPRHMTLAKRLEERKRSVSELNLIGSSMIQEIGDCDAHVKNPLGDCPIQKLKVHAYRRYKRFEVGEGGKKMKYIQLAVLRGSPDIPRSQDREEANDPSVLLQEYRDYGRDNRKVDGHMDVSQLLRKEGDNMRVIYGQAGVGKTTLLKHICRALAMEEVESNYTLVLYFPLREKTVISAKDLRELLSYYASGDMKLDLSELTQCLINSKEKEILIIFDGADEVIELLSAQGGIIFQEILRGHVLPQADVIVTGRPGSLPFLQEHSTVFYEIHGFSLESTESYVCEFFRDEPEKGQKMLDELRSRPDLIGGAYIPMNLFIFCTIYAGRKFPPTMTLCYKQFISNVITRECKKNGIPFQVDPLLSSLSDDVKKLLASLGELAYQGMKKTPPTFVFEEDDIRRAFSILKPEAPIEESLFKGLLHQHSRTVGFGIRNSFNFSHTTNQEFFTAYHISHLPKKQQLNFLKQSIPNPKFAMVIRFYAGLTGLSSREVSRFLYQPNHDPSFLEILRNLFSLKSSSTPSLCDNDHPHLLHLFHSLYESQNVSLTKRIAQQLNPSLMLNLHLAPHDTLAIAQCLSNCTHLRRMRFSHTLSPSSLPHVFTILKVNCQLQSLMLRTDHLSLSDAGSLVRVSSAEDMHLSVMETTTLSALSAIFSSTTISTLSLEVWGNVTDINSECSKSELVRSVAGNTTLKKLNLLGQSDYKIQVLHAVAGSTSIEDLQILRSVRHVGPTRSVSHDGTKCGVAEALATTCAVNVKLQRVRMRDISPLPLMRSLATRKVPLDELQITFPFVWSKVLTEDELDEMKKNAAEMKVLKVLVDVRNNPGVCDAISIGFGQNKFLKELCLRSVPKGKMHSARSNVSLLETVSFY